MSKKTKSRNLEGIFPKNKLNSPKPISSFLDVMEDGREYESLIKLSNVSIDFTSEIKRSLTEISNIRQRPIVCYAANVINNNITQSHFF